MTTHSAPELTLNAACILITGAVVGASLLLIACIVLGVGGKLG